MLGGGKSVDLIKLFFNVKKKGGYKKVTENGLWDFVASECGFDLSDGLALKLVYAENLEIIHKSLKTIFEERKVKRVVKMEEHSISNTHGGGCSTNLKSNSNSEPFLSGIRKKKTNHMKMDRDLVKLKEYMENYHTRCVPNYVIDLEDEEEEGIPNVSASGVCSMDLSSDSEPLISEVSNIKKKKAAIYPKVDLDKCDSDNFCVAKLPEKVFRHDPVESFGDIKNENIEDYHTRCVPNYVIDLEEEGIPIVNASGVCSMDLSSDSEPFLSEVSNIKKKKAAIYTKVDLDKCDSDDFCVAKLPEKVFHHDPVKSNGNIKKENIENYHTRCVPNYVIDLEEEGIPNVNASDVCSMDLSANLEPFLPDVSNIKKNKAAIYAKVDSDKCDSNDVCGFRQVCSNLEPFLSEVSNIKKKRAAIYAKVDSEKCDSDDVCGFGQVCSNMEPFLSQVSNIKKKKAAIYTKVDSDKCNSDDVCLLEKFYHHDPVKSKGDIKTLGKLSEINHSHDPVKSNGDTKNSHTKSIPDHVDLWKKNAFVIDNRSDYSVIKEDVCCLKRKRESAIGILDWIYRVARDPCDPVIGLLPEFSEWKDYTTEIIWKQVLLIHEAMLIKRNGYSNDQHFIMQKRPRMHPTMYDEPEKFRQSQRINSTKNLTNKPHSRTVSKSSFKNPKSKIKLPDYLSKKHHQMGVNLGQEYQADVHEWTEKNSSSSYEADSKWLGTPIWELGEQQQQNKKLIEREPIGKGRSDSCGCHFSGSTECVRFHVSEKSKRLKLELGIAFYLWRFNRMGEETSVTWTKEEEKKFHDTWKLNPILSLGGFLDESIKALPCKSRASLVNYYFNVFILRRRGEQNRTLPYNISSDDDDDNDNDDSISENVKPKTLDSSKKTRLKKSK